MGAGAPEGNTNNLKWTLEAAQELFNDLLETVKNDPKCSSMAACTSKLGYYETLVPYLKEKYKDIDFKPIKEAESIIKARLIQKGLENEYNPTMSIFILKNNHDMNDKVDHTSGGEKIQSGNTVEKVIVEFVDFSEEDEDTTE